MRKLLFTTLFFLPIFYNVFSQDTIRVMQYNLMQYCTPYGTCTTTNNGIDAKAANLKIILNQVSPDILVVEEIGSTMTYVNHLLNNALNVDGINWWKNGQLSNASGGSIANMMYYDSRKFTLKESFFVQTAVRDFNIYRLYYNTPDLVNGDTTFFIPILGHLKAGSTLTDSTDRNSQVAALMSRLNSWNVADNYILCGDFNIYTSAEPCYQQLLNYPNSLIRFYDPINKPGAWNNNYNFANIHTQSTHTSGDCFASGGLDDRFDFILTSANVLNGYDKIKAIPSSYHALGQDGSRFNGTIISPTNNLVPSAVANAMYNMSDHLPLIMDFQVYYPSCGTSIGKSVKSNFALNLQNPVADQLIFNYRTEVKSALSMTIIDINGRIIFQKSIPAGDSEAVFSEPVSFLTPGIYFLRLVSDQGIAVVKFVKQ